MLGSSIYSPDILVQELERMLARDETAQSTAMPAWVKNEVAEQLSAAHIGVGFCFMLVVTIGEGLASPIFELPFYQQKCLVPSIRTRP